MSLYRGQLACYDFTENHMNEIKLIQAPVIQYSLIEVGKNVAARIKELNIDNLVATEETIKALKELRAALNKELADYETQRKTIKEAVSHPYSEFETVFKSEITEKYKQAIDTLKDKIGAFEAKVKTEKKANVTRYFEELCVSEGIDFLTFEQTGLEINLSTSEKQYKDKCNDFVLKVKDDVNLINSTECPAEIMAEYKTTLNASKAITTVRERKQREKLEKERLKLAETNRRESLLRGLSMVYNSLVKTFVWAEDESIYIKQTDVEDLSLEDFQKKYIEIESLISTKKKERQCEPELMQNEQVPGPASINDSQQPKVADPLPAPSEVKEEPKEEIFSAAFEVQGTMKQLMSLGQYMKENGISYKNI